VNVFDQAARYMVKGDPQGFLRWLLPGLDPDLAFARWLDTGTIPFPGEPDRRCDTVAELLHKSGLGPPWALVAEFQTRVDAEIFERLLEYLARVRRELRHGPYRRDKYQVGAALVNLTGAGAVTPLEMVLPGQAGVELRWTVKVRNLRDEDAAGALAAVEAGEASTFVLPWVPLMKGGADGQIQQKWKELALRETDHRRRADCGSLALIFADLAQRRDTWAAVLEEWDMEESQVVTDWQAKALQKMLREKLTKLLRTRFGAELPEQVLTIVQGENKVDRLSRWMDAAIECDSLSTFEGVLRE
jgi:hypothetical protein